MTAEEQFRQAFATQSAGKIEAACDIWRNFFETKHGKNDFDTIALSNYLFCLLHLKRNDELISFSKKYFHSESWFDTPSVPESQREMPASEATADRVVASLRTFGVVLLRGHYDPDLIEYLGAKTADLRDGKAKQLYDLFTSEEVLRLVSPLMSEVLQLGNFQVAPDPGPSWIRVVMPRRPETSVPFHQDMKAFSRRCINTWVPLTPAGKDTPGLELLPIFIAGILPSRGQSPTHYSSMGLEIDRTDLSSAFPDIPLWRPIMEPGDMMMFLGSTVHRTHVTADMRRARRSLELRFNTR